MRDDRQRLVDILEAIDRIEKYSSFGKERFESDELIQTWIVHYLQQTGEAIAKLNPEVLTDHPEIPWRQIIAMRNLLVHVYYNIDLTEIWTVVSRDLPELKRQINMVLTDYK